MDLSAGARPWDRTYKDGERLNLEELNEFKDSLLRPFLPLKEVFSDRQSTVREMTAALAEFSGERGGGEASVPLGKSVSRDGRG